MQNILKKLKIVFISCNKIENDWQNSYNKIERPLCCSKQVITILIEDQYHLVNAFEHNHATEANRVKVIKKINVLKERV